jgi:hypothetical protein
VLFCDLVNSTQHRRSLIVYWKVEDSGKNGGRQ